MGPLGVIYTWIMLDHLQQSLHPYICTRIENQIPQIFSNKSPIWTLATIVTTTPHIWGVTVHSLPLSLLHLAVIGNCVERWWLMIGDQGLTGGFSMAEG